MRKEGENELMYRQRNKERWVESVKTSEEVLKRRQSGYVGILVSKSLKFTIFRINKIKWLENKLTVKVEFAWVLPPLENARRKLAFYEMKCSRAFSVFSNMVKGNHFLERRAHYFDKNILEFQWRQLLCQLIWPDFNN